MTPLKRLRKSYHQGRMSVLSDSSFFARKPVFAYFQDFTTLTFMTQKLISLWENERSGLMNSALMSTFMIRSLPVLVPIIA